MKLLVCLKCSSIFNLKVGVEKQCDFGLSKGKYINNEMAEYLG